MNYLSLQSTARRLIGSNGTKCVLRNPTGDQVYNPDNDTYTQIYEEYEGVCIITSYADGIADGTVIKSDDSRVVCVIDAKPIPSSSLLDVYDKNGNVVKIYHVISAQPKSPDATTVLCYILQCRE
jgi:hypothetical protein